jgi:hypothetical protein
MKVSRERESVYDIVGRKERKRGKDMKQISKVEGKSVHGVFKYLSRGRILGRNLVPKCEIFDCSDFMIFTPSSLWVGR